MEAGFSVAIAIAGRLILTPVDQPGQKALQVLINTLVCCFSAFN